jgi:hypothetical protein
MELVALVVLIGCFALGYGTGSYTGMVVPGGLVVAALSVYANRRTGGQPDETDVLPGLFLAISLLALGVYVLGVNRRRAHDGIRR